MRAACSDQGDFAGLVSVGRPEARLEGMAVDAEVEARLRRVVREQEERGRLRKHGFAPCRRVLLHGPPGTGKTMAASALAAELGVPLISIHMEGLLLKFHGEATAKVGLLFDAFELSRVAYLFDEFGVLGGEHTAPSAVAELRFVLDASFRRFEQSAPDCLLFVATSNPRLLDPSLLRRFDASIDFRLPTPDIAERVAHAFLATMNVEQIDWALVRRAAEGLSHADLVPMRSTERLTPCR